jgi:phosphatidylglycerophosphatase A
MRTLLKHIATLWFIGYLPVAPGTFGSLFALALFVLLKPSLSTHFILLALITLVGVISSHIAEILLHERDSGHIVIDEVCGYFVSVLFLPMSLGYAVAAFFLFRFFDILKPFPIRQIESAMKGGIGIVTDDILAGIYANLVLQVWNISFR